MACALPGEDLLSQCPGNLSRFPSNSSSCLSPTRVTLPCRGTAGATLPHCSEVTALLGFEYVKWEQGRRGQWGPETSGSAPASSPEHAFKALRTSSSVFGILNCLYQLRPQCSPRWSLLPPHGLHWGPRVCTISPKGPCGVSPSFRWCCTVSLHSTPAPVWTIIWGALFLFSACQAASFSSFMECLEPLPSKEPSGTLGVQSYSHPSQSKHNTTDFLIYCCTKISTT